MKRKLLFLPEFIVDSVPELKKLEVFPKFIDLEKFSKLNDIIYLIKKCLINFLT